MTLVSVQSSSRFCRSVPRGGQGGDVETVFGVFGDLLRGLVSLFPRICFIRMTHRGVAFTRSKCFSLGPGVHWYWPIWTEIVEYPVVMQTVNLDTQTLVTADNQVLTVSGIITYEIDNIEQALAGTYDIERVIKDMGLVAIKQVVSSKTFKELTADEKNVDKWLTEKATLSLSSYGVKVSAAYLSDLCPSTVFRIWGESRPLPMLQS